MFEEKLLEPHFTSVLAPYMLDVVEQKRALGNKYNAGVEALSAFDDFCNEQQLRIPEAGKNLIYIRDFLGHESIETTQVYANANPEARRKALETMDTRMNTPAMPDWNDDPDLKAFLKTL